MNPWGESKTMNKLEEKKSFRMEGGFLFVFFKFNAFLDINEHFFATSDKI